MFLKLVSYQKSFAHTTGVTEAGKVGSPLAKTFFMNEYQLNYSTGTLQKPYIALISGITMGGVSY